MASENFNRDSLRVLEEIRELLSTGGTASLTCLNHLELVKTLLTNSKEKSKRQADEDIPMERKRFKKSGMQDHVKFEASKKLLKMLVEHTRSEQRMQDFDDKFIIPGHEGYQLFKKFSMS
jgi:hypothetical protein